MKTFKQFFEENQGTPAPIFKLEELLNGDCKNFFRQSQKKGLLFRGMNGFGKYQGGLQIGEKQFNLYKKAVRKDRKPMSTKGPVHKIIDDWFEEEMGMKARSQAVFCTGERGRGTAETYGDIAVILPIGKFIYTWSPQVDDLFDIIKDKFEDRNSSTGKFRQEWLGSDGKPDAELIGAGMDELKYTINNFDKACAGHQEIMIECDEYYVIPYKDEDELGLIKKAFVEA